MNTPRGPVDDPGWGPVLRDAAWSLVPFLGVRRSKRLVREQGMEALTVLRITFAAFAGAIFHIGVVVVVLARSEGFEGGGLASPPVALGVAVVGAASLAAVRFLPLPLDCSSEAALLGGYRTRFFLRIAFAEAAALVGFLGFIVTVEPLVYVVGAAFTAAGFALLAPTAGNLARDQYRLDAAGCTYNLMALLRRPGNAGPE